MDIFVRKVGAVGHITLNRPDALNSLTYEMLSRIENALDIWLDDPQVSVVIIDSNGEKAFCAGGDIQDLYSAFDFIRHLILIRKLLKRSIKNKNIHI